MVGNTVALLEGRVGTRCMVMLGGREVDGYNIINMTTTTTACKYYYLHGG